MWPIVARVSVESLVRQPIKALLGRLGGIQVHPDPYSGPFEAYHHHATGTQTWDVAAIEAVARETGGRVLDVGCGRGRLALALASAGHDVTAVDTSEPAIARLRELAAGRIEVLAGDVTDPALLPARRFGLAALADLSINLFDTDEAVTSLFAAVERVLAPGGRLCLPVLSSVDQFARLRGMTGVPFTDDAGGQRLMWLVLHYEADGPYFHRSLFLQDDNAVDGSFAGHVTAVRERLWTTETLRPHLAATGLRVTGTRPLRIPAAGVPASAELLVVGRSVDG
jgi:SAM-dependent methyltransferase